MVDFILVYIALVILNYIAVYMTETVRWNILETTISYSKEEYEAENRRLRELGPRLVIK